MFPGFTCDVPNAFNQKGAVEMNFNRTFEFVCPTKIIFEVGGAERLGEKLKAQVSFNAMRGPKNKIPPYEAKDPNENGYSHNSHRADK